MQSTGLAVLLAHATPPVQVQWSNIHPVEGAGRFAMAWKFDAHTEAGWKYECVFPQAVIEAGEAAPMKFVGED